MRAVLCLCVTALAGACGAPGGDFASAPVQRLHLGGGTFDIRVKGRRAEAIRVNPQWAPNLSAVGVPAVLAIERASGCRVDRLTGDAARMEARLDCGAGPLPAHRPGGDYYCDLDAYGDDFASGLCLPADEMWPRPG